MLRPLPKLDEVQTMAKLGRAYAIRSARLDALHDLRDACTRLMNTDLASAECIAIARECLDRVEQLDAL